MSKSANNFYTLSDLEKKLRKQAQDRLMKVAGHSRNKMVLQPHEIVLSTLIINSLW